MEKKIICLDNLYDISNMGQYECNMQCILLDTYGN